MQHTNAKPLFIHAAPFVFVVLWATGFVVAKLSAGHVAPVWFLGLRFVLAGIFMLGLALVQKARWPAPRLAFHAAVAGALLHALYLAPIYWAVANGMPAGVSALIVGLQPLLTTFLAAGMVHERISERHWIGLAIGIAGIALVIGPKLNFNLLGGSTHFTSSLVVLGAMAISLDTVYQKKYLTRVALSTGGVWQYVGASVMALGIAFVLGDFTFDFSWKAWSAMGWAVFVLSILSILLLTLMIREGEVSRVSAFIFLVPAVSSLMTFALFDEKLVPMQLVGMAVCACAVLVVNLRPGAMAWRAGR